MISVKLFLKLSFVLVLLSGCSFKQVLTSTKVDQSQINQSKKESKREITFTRIAPVHQTGKHSFRGLALLENGKILAIGYDGENPRRLRTSIDEGKIWETRLFTDDFTMPSAICFKDNQHGWIGGDRDVFRTSDGGENWEKKSLETTYIAFADISFYDLKTGYIAGNHNVEGERAGQIFVTRDGGETWIKSYESKVWTNPFSIVAISENVALAVLDENNLIRTDDRGKSWKSIKSFNYRINKLTADLNGKIWAVGRDGNFFFSLDNGFTWLRPSEFPKNFDSKSWNSISFVNNKIGFAVGEKGMFGLTADGGDSWKEITTDLNEDLYDVYTNQSFGIIKGSENLYKIQY